MKKCARCGVERGSFMFYRSGTNLDGLQGKCKSCISEDRSAYYQEHRTHIIRRQKKWNRANTKRAVLSATERRFRSRYGITMVQYEEMFAAQGGVCRICGREASGKRTRLFVDHDHRNGKVRGLLCNNCNRGIGLLQDSIEVIGTALSYLKEHHEASHPPNAG